MNKWFLADTAADGRELWRTGYDYPCAVVREFSSGFNWNVYGIDGNDEVTGGKTLQLQLAINEATQALNTYINLK